ncbi:MAG: EamA family transporter [Sneathiellales bacterium]|nr:EamA family transporter [Sneathiellales bacterium]
MPKPFLITFAAMLCWALLSVVSRILLLKFEFDPWMFSFVQLSAGGAALIALSRRGRFELTSFKRPSTWVLGVLRVLSASLFTVVLGWVSVLETGLIGTLNLPVIALAVWLLYGKRVTHLESIGHFLLLFAILFLVLGLEGDMRGIVGGFMILNAICLAAITLISERHPDNISDAPGARARFTGAVLLVTAGFFLLTRFVQTGVSFEAIDLPLLVSGVLVGIILRAPAMFLVFWSIRLVGAFRYTASVVFLPMLGFLFEQTASFLGLLKSSSLEIKTLIAAGAVFLGTALVLAGKRGLSKGKRKRQYSPE